MGRKARVLNEPFLERDIESGIILNKDRSSFMNAVNRKKIYKQKKLEEEQKERELMNMKEEIESLKKLVNTLIHNSK